MSSSCEHKGSHASPSSSPSHFPPIIRPSGKWVPHPPTPTYLTQENPLLIHPLFQGGGVGKSCGMARNQLSRLGKLGVYAFFESSSSSPTVFLFSGHDFFLPRVFSAAGNKRLSSFPLRSIKPTLPLSVETAPPPNIP